MAAQRGQQHHGRMLSINLPPNLAQQAGGQPLFSPALPTALQTQFRPSMPFHMNPMQTPMQSQFFPQAAPFIPGHQQRGSIVGPHGMTLPITPGFNPGFQQHQLPPHLAAAAAVAAAAAAGGAPGTAGPQGGGGHGRSGSVSMPFNRNRRQNSVSLGGPPKATLGGPANKHTAAPLMNPSSSTAVLEKTLKGKKLTVKVPNESATEDGGPIPAYARTPIPVSELPHFVEPLALDTATAPLFPEERPKGELPKSIDVFLPGKDAWDVLKRAMIEERLTKLGVERSGVPPIFAHGVHGRAASISSPADPNLLMFKLNKLHQHQAQVTSPGSGHLSVSPGPRVQQNHSPSPNHLQGGPSVWSNAPGGNHRHSMSLANPTYSPHAYNSSTTTTYNASGAFNPFGPSATLGSDQIISPSFSAGSGRGRLPTITDDLANNSDDGSGAGRIHAPRGVPGHLATSALGRPDFVRGFGLDITEETEEELEQEGLSDAVSDIVNSEVAAALQEELDAIPEVDETPSRSGSRRHSRHTSRVSAALSLRSLGRGGKSDSGIMEEEEEEAAHEAIRAWESEGAARSMKDDDGADAANEWTASDDEQSVGEYSNPSDEERAREARKTRIRAKMLRQKGKDHPHQPQLVHSNSLTVPRMGRGLEQDSDDIVSNPSEEERLYNRRPSASRPLPALPTSATHSRAGSGQIFSHSRNGSGQYLASSIPLPHSRGPSGQFSAGSHHTTPPVASPGANGQHGFAINHRDSLNPHAKPFVFGKPWYNSTSATPQSTATVTPPAQPLAAVSRLSVAAPEFKPNFTIPEFKPSPAAKEFKPNASAPEFRPSPSAPEFKPTFTSSSSLLPPLPAAEPKPSSLPVPKAKTDSGDFLSRLGEIRSSPLPNIVDLVADFTFRPPPVAPQLTFPEPALIAEPAQPVNAFGRAVQGREKRARKDSNPEVNLEGDAQEEEQPSGQELLVLPTQNAHEPTPAGADSFTWNNLTAYKFPDEEDVVVSEPEPEVSRAPVHKSPNKTFTFPPNKKSITSVPIPVTESPEIISTPAEAQHAKNADSIGRSRSPRPPPLHELPKRGSGVDSPASRPTSARALPQPPQRAQTLFNDYKPHPVTTNTVPASLFKNLSVSNPVEDDMDGDDDDDAPLATLTARLASIDRFDHTHKPSLDDIHMPMIARKRVSENRESGLKDQLVTAPEQSAPKPHLSVPAIPTTPGVTTPRSFAQEQESQVSSDLMDEKLEALRNDVRSLVEAHLLKVNSATSVRAEEALMRIARLMRDQAAEKQSQDAAVERTPGRGAVDPAIIRSIVDESNKEVCDTLQHDLANLARHVQAGVQLHPGADILRTVEEQASRIINAVSGATISLAARLEAVHSIVETAPQVHHLPSQQASHGRVPSHEDLLRVLRPHLEQLRSVPFDVDVVTARLAEAVKPTLADFIDLASDKGETADLIVAKLAPALNGMRPSQLNSQEIAVQLAADVSRLVPPVDSHALTEQVADLVVERLDSRLSVREKSLKPEVLAQKVAEALKTVGSSGDSQMLSRMDGHLKSYGEQIQALELSIRQSHAQADTTKKSHGDKLHTKNAPSLHETQQVLSGMRTVLQEHEAHRADGLLHQFRSLFEPVNNALLRGHDSIIATQSNLVESAQQTQNMVDSGLNDLFHSQEAARNHLQDLFANSGKILDQTSTLPEHLASLRDSLILMQTDLQSKLRSLPDVVDLQNQRMDLQVQLTKARTSYGQARSEKDVLGERAHSLESERDRLRADLQALKTTLAEKEAETASSISRAEQAEKGLQQALSRVETSDAVTKTLKEQILRIETAHRDLQRSSNERQAKVDSLELQLKFATQDKESAQETLRRVEQERDTAVEQQQESWRESKINSQKIDSLLQLLTAKESEELRELRRHKDRTRGTEAELASTKQRLADLESKMEALIRSEAKSTQALEDSRRQVEEAETKVTSLQREIEPLRRLDEAQKTRDRDFEEIRAQLEMQEKQEDSLRRSNDALQEELSAVRNELELSRKAQATAKWQQHQAKEPTPAYARATPTINGRSHTAQRAESSRSNTPPATQNGVWTSIHAPVKNGKVPSGYQAVTPRSALPVNGRSTQHSAYGRAVSPAQSVVSQAPTLREDGWWE
ncbi:hypothetical protein M408DRAFT_297474 [Serendipita vermifera MAFF 305830]|uniref:Uncharacterized protein n=1 Tax=Serendipita vermifera MAFF 305830 TaxID=933852 RepID=A0A0C3APJ3_SERVB|nr:hypothetical protein M408DRAFT_297474 [Serendipita vermifera MAFF 305830]